MSARVDVVVVPNGLTTSRLDLLAGRLCDGLDRPFDVTVVMEWSRCVRYVVHLEDVKPDDVEAESLLWLSAHGAGYTVIERST